MTAWKWDTNIPMHLRKFWDTMMQDMDRLQKDHLNLLANGVPEGEHFVEKDSVYLRAMVVLLCAGWEAFVEDLLESAVNLIIDNTDDGSKLPKTLRKLVADEIRRGKNELSPWLLSGNKWKEYVRVYCRTKISKLNTPTSEHIKRVYVELLNVDILEAWEWEYDAGADGMVRFDRENNSQIIDDFVSCRGSIAHGRGVFKYSTLPLLYVGAVFSEISGRMTNKVNTLLEQLTGRLPWPTFRSNIDWRRFAHRIEE